MIQWRLMRFNRCRISQWFVTGFGLGYLPRAPGTAGSLLGVLLFLPIESIGRPYAFLLLAILFVVSVKMIDLSLPLFARKDPREIVIDEIWAILFIFFMIPSSLISWTVGFGLFRFFDITKPPPVRQAEALPSGWGVMADDLVAAVYTIVMIEMAYRVLAYLGYRL